MKQDATLPCRSRRWLLARALMTGGAALALLAGCRGEATTNRPASPRKPAETPAPLAALARPSDEPAVAVQVWAGSIAQLIRARVAPDFERTHGVRLVVDEGSTADQLAAVRAERDQPRHVVVGLDDGAVGAARREGLISPLDVKDVPNLADVYPEYVFEDNHGVALGVSWIAGWYNPERVKSAPDSYAAFWDSRYKGRAAVPSIETTAGVQWLVVAAALATGKPLAEAQYNVELGFEKWRQLKPNLHSTFESFSMVAPLLAQGEVWLGFGSSRQACTFIAKGAPIARAPAVEGVFFGTNALALVKHPTLEPLGRDLVNRLLAPGLQGELARAAGTGPASRKAEVPPELAKLVPVGPEDTRAAVKLDWSYVNRNLAAWSTRWHAEVGS